VFEAGGSGPVRCAGDAGAVALSVGSRWRCSKARARAGMAIFC